MRVAHIAASDRRGGAAIAAYRLHEGLRKVGIESRMLVRDKVTSDPDVDCVRVSPQGVTTRILEKLKRIKIQQEFGRYKKTISPQLELFSDCRVPGEGGPFLSEVGVDAINLHWVSGFIDNWKFFSRLKFGTPLVWTLHDMNPFTGGCHYSLGCNGTVYGCGACPQLGSNRQRDLSAKVFEIKRAALGLLSADTTRIVATTKWLRDEANRAEMFRGFQVELIPYGLDVNKFQPRDKLISRQRFEVPEGDLVLIFVADYVGNYRKGFDLLLAALDGLTATKPITLIAVGSNAPSELAGHRVIRLGRIEDESLLSFAYSAADLFVMPTRAEAFGQVTLEAMACGTPVVAFNVGGVPDLVRPYETGLLASAQDSNALRQSMEESLNDRHLRIAMSINCRQVAVKEYSLESQARKYKDLYSELALASSNLHRAC